METMSGLMMRVRCLEELFYAQKTNNIFIIRPKDDGLQIIIIHPILNDNNKK